MAGIALGKKIRQLFAGKNELDEAFFEELEDTLIESDIGAKTAMELVDQLRDNKAVKKGGEEAVLMQLKEALAGYVQSYETKPDDGLSFYLVLGVNGVGKTTSIAKMASYMKEHYGRKVVLAAGDTFRAAAIDQLQIHGERLGMRVVHQEHGADPGAVIYDSLESALSKGEDLVFADTAGRMHNKQNLIRELAKIDKIVARKLGDRPYKKFLVLDATTGQNALRQAEMFHEAVGVDAVILAKYDSAAKGGIIIPIQRDLGIPVAFIGTGESYGDIQAFDGDAFLDTLLSL